MRNMTVAPIVAAKTEAAPPTSQPAEQDAPGDGPPRAARERQRHDRGVKRDKGAKAEKHVSLDVTAQSLTVLGEGRDREVAVPAHGECEGRRTEKGEKRPKPLE